MNIKTDLELKLWYLENEGCHLYYDERSKKWQCFGERLSYFGEDKTEVINTSYAKLTGADKPY